MHVDITPRPAQCRRRLVQSGVPHVVARGDDGDPPSQKSSMIIFSSPTLRNSR